MATLSGTQVIAKVVPVDSADTYPTHDEVYGKGGYRTVADSTARDAIPAARRTSGMLVQTLDNGHFYTLDANLTTWADKGTLTGGGGGSSSPYPDNVSFLTVNTTLNSTHQGWITAAATNLTFLLPATAANGTTYKFIGSEVNFTVDANGNSFSGLPGTSTVITPVRKVILMAVNIPSLVWFVITPELALAYDAAATYISGNIVLESSVPYLLFSGPSTGVAPSATPSQWLKLQDVGTYITGILADQATAQAGTDNTTLMTPLRTAQAISALGGGGGSTTYTTFNNGSGIYNNVSINGANEAFLIYQGSYPTVTGIVAPASQGARVVISFIGSASGTLTITHADAQSSIANQFSTATGANISVPVGSSIMFMYWNNAWRQIKLV